MTTQVTESQLFRAFESAIEPVRVSGLYRLAMGLVALLMVLLPALYVALIGVAGYYTYLAATIPDGPWYLAIVGGILTLFMFKPLFARRVASVEPNALSQSQHRRLFKFVYELCDVVGAPTPSAIAVDNEVNASAGFRRGFWSMFRSDLVLTIGLPLVGGLSIRQLTGVLAHEFGHFAQGSGMRVTYLVRSINIWFARVVYERDALDQLLVRGSQAIDIRIAWILYLARIGIWLTRKVLWVLMQIGHGVSCFMLRQMEYDADRYETRVSGSDAFEATVYQLQKLNAASQLAYDDLGQAWAEHRLGDNLPRLIAARCDDLPADATELIRVHMEEESTGLFDTHPADLDRVRSAKAENAPGIFRLDAPATVLFDDYDELCRKTTLDQYRLALEQPVDAGMLVKTDRLLAEQREIERNAEALAAFVGVTPGDVHLLGLTAQEEAEHGGADPATQIRAARREQHNQVQLARDLLKGYDELRERELSLHQAQALLTGKFRIAKEDYGLSHGNLNAVQQELGNITPQKRQRVDALMPLARAANRRLGTALRLLELPGIADKLGDQIAVDAVSRFKLPLETLAGLSPLLEEIPEQLIALAALMEQVGDSDVEESLYAAIMTYSRRLVALIDRIRQAAAVALYPYEHGRGSVGLDAYLVPEETPAQQEVGQVLPMAASIFEQARRLQNRILGDLVQLALRAEEALGLEKSELPPPTP